jgi:hypothetical protein
MDTTSFGRFSRILDETLRVRCWPPILDADSRGADMALELLIWLIDSRRSLRIMSSLACFNTGRFLKLKAPNSSFSARSRSACRSATMLPSRLMVPADGEG